MSLVNLSHINSHGTVVHIAGNDLKLSRYRSGLDGRVTVRV